LHSPAHYLVFARALLHRRYVRAPPRGPSPLRTVWRQSHGGSWGADAGRSEEGIAGSELVAGRGQQRYLGTQPIDMLSRVADNLYWMSRYLERAEHTARTLDVNLNLMLDESASGVDRRWQRV